MTVIDRLGIVASFVLIVAVLLGISARKPRVITETRSEVDAQVIGDISIINAQWPAESSSREYGNEFEPRGM